MQGSPPRMRGKRYETSAESEARRITPAHAGKTALKAELDEVAADHPRACGENRSAPKASGSSSGSPPRMRGKPADVLDSVLLARITPAHAGKTSSSVSFAFLSSDHPRACGENGAEPRFVGERDGSPPRMRGKPSYTDAISVRARITPAHAGKT